MDMSNCYDDRIPLIYQEIIKRQQVLLDRWYFRCIIRINATSFVDIAAGFLSGQT
jgi:hypothetical protein